MERIECQEQMLSLCLQAYVVDCNIPLSVLCSSRSGNQLTFEDIVLLPKNHHFLDLFI